VSPLLAISLLLSSASARVDSVQLSDTGSRTAVRIEWTGTPALVAVHREGNEARVSMSDAEMGLLFSGGSRFEYTSATAPAPISSAPFEGIRIESRAGEIFFYFRVASDTPVDVQRGADFMIVSFREGIPGGMVLSERPSAPVRSAAAMPSPFAPAPRPAPPPPVQARPPAATAAPPPAAVTPPPPRSATPPPSTFAPLPAPGIAATPVTPAPTPAPVPPAPTASASASLEAPGGLVSDVSSAPVVSVPESTATPEAVPAPAAETADLYKRIFPVPTAEPAGPEPGEPGAPSSELYSKLFPHTPEGAPAAATPTPAAESTPAPEDVTPGLHLGPVNVRPGVRAAYVDANANFLSTPQPVRDQYLEFQPRLAADAPVGAGRLGLLYEPTIRALGSYDVTRSSTHPVQLTFDAPIGQRSRLKLQDQFVSGVLETTEVDPGGEYFFGLGRFNKNDVGGTASIEVSPRFTVELGGGFDYVDFRQQSAFFDYQRRYGSAGVGFEATPTLKAIFAYGYDSVPASGGRPESESRAHSLQGTLAGDILPLLRGSLTVGYRDQKSPNAAAEGQRFKGVTATGTLTRDFGHESALTLLVNRSTPLSNFQENGFYVSTSISASLLAPLPWSVAFNAGGGYHWNDYRTFITGTSLKREDRLFGWFVGLRRPVDRRTTIFAGYRREQRRSNLDVFESDTDGFLLQLDVDVFGRTPRR